MGSVIALKNAKGEVVNRYSYDVWGDLIASEEQVPNAIRYRGEYQDAETGFYYLRGRYYDPATRKFTTLDPAEDGLNWNMYCEGNPIDYVDPSGYVKVAMRKVRMPMKAEIFAYETYYSGDNLFDIITEIESDLAAISEEIIGMIPGLNAVQAILNIKAALKDSGVSYAAVLAGQHRKGLRVVIYKENNTEIGVKKEEVDREFVERLATTPFYVGRSY